MKNQERRAFTMVELLVVVAIIAFLAAIAFPSFTKAMDISKSAKCIGNLRGIGAAALAYSAENDGRLPPIAKSYNWNAENATNWWMTFLANPGSSNAVDVRKIWRCPCVSDQDFHASGAITYSTYTPLKPLVTFVTTSSPDGSYKLAQIQKPSVIWMFGDGGIPLGSVDPNRPPQRYETAGAIDRWPKRWGSTARPAFRHGGYRANYVACDGHVESISWDKSTNIDCGPFGYYESASGDAQF
jgi:prepilin-type N-terminal cleavage/methylation domain-containing protein/prepilin-type processing-associated H-X9-DG protein